MKLQAPEVEGKEEAEVVEEVVEKEVVEMLSGQQI